MLFSKYSTRLSYINVSPFHLGPATTLASLLLARAILQIFEATLYEFLDPWILLFLFKMAEPRRPIAAQSCLPPAAPAHSILESARTVSDARKGRKRNGEKTHLTKISWVL